LLLTAAITKNAKCRTFLQAYICLLYECARSSIQGKQVKQFVEKLQESAADDEAKKRRKR
jgi:hypothetical protein